MPNRLREETSPYLLQHKDNPVEWYPWCDEALERATQENKPIFLSIGYSACHWCHVMEHESFEDPQIASFLNENFVSIKVDREERPDLDQVYMQAVMGLIGQGGWPLSVFLTPELHVFYGGTYWPPRPNANMPGFIDVLRRIQEAFHNKRTEIEQQAQQITDWLNERNQSTIGILTKEDLVDAKQGMQREFDFGHGGFGTAPKFPHSSSLRFLLRFQSPVTNQTDEMARRMVVQNLDAMRAGGIYDQIGGGFARYSVDREWLVPHFEKMLYDNAQLASFYLESHVALEKHDYATIARETLDFMLNELLDPLGGLHSSLDADSEGVEGKFYVWSREQILGCLGSDLGNAICNYFGATEHGNFEGENILFLPRQTAEFLSDTKTNPDNWSVNLQVARQKMYAARSERIPPHKDDKVICSWNALGISALADGARILNSKRYLEAAERGMAFTFKQLLNREGRLLRSYRKGIAKPEAFLDDYSYTLVALLDLYRATFNEEYIDKAVDLANDMLLLFNDPESPTLYFVGVDQPPLISRMKDVQDASIPSGNAMAAEGLLRLGRLTENKTFITRAEGICAAMSATMKRSPLSMGQAWVVAQQMLVLSEEWVFVVESNDQRDELQVLLNKLWLRQINVLIRVRGETKKPLSEHLEPLFKGRFDPSGSTLNAPAQWFVCQGNHCQAPIAGWESIVHRLTALKNSNAV